MGANLLQWIDLGGHIWDGAVHGTAFRHDWGDLTDKLCCITNLCHGTLQIQAIESWVFRSVSRPELHNLEDDGKQYQQTVSGLSSNSDSAIGHAKRRSRRDVADMSCTSWSQHDHFFD